MCVNCDTIDVGQTKGQVNEQSRQDKSQTNNKSKINPPNTNKTNHEMDYFIVGPVKEVDILGSPKITKEMHVTFSNVFFGIGCFKDTFSLQLKESAKPYQTLLPRHVVCILKAFKMN